MSPVKRVYPAYCPLPLYDPGRYGFGIENGLIGSKIRHQMSGEIRDHESSFKKRFEEFWERYKPYSDKKIFGKNTKLVSSEMVGLITQEVWTLIIVALKGRINCRN